MAYSGLRGTVLPGSFRTSSIRINCVDSLRACGAVRVAQLAFAATQSERCRPDQLGNVVRSSELELDQEEEWHTT